MIDENCLIFILSIAFINFDNILNNWSITIINNDLNPVDLL